MDAHLVRSSPVWMPLCSLSTQTLSDRVIVCMILCFSFRTFLECDKSFHRLCLSGNVERARGMFAGVCSFCRSNLKRYLKNLSANRGTGRRQVISLLHNDGDRDSSPQTYEETLNVKHQISRFVCL